LFPDDAVEDHKHANAHDDERGGLFETSFASLTKVLKNSPSNALKPHSHFHSPTPPTPLVLRSDELLSHGTLMAMKTPHTNISVLVSSLMTYKVRGHMP